MKGSRRPSRAWLAAYVLLAALAYLARPVPAVNALMQNALYQRPAQPMPNLFVIGIDDKSLERLGPWNTWPRTHMADLIRLLNGEPERRPAVIGVDVMYFGETTPEADGALADAVALADNVVLAGQIAFGSEVVQEGAGYRLDTMHIAGLNRPQPPLDTLAASGFTDVFLDRDGTVRRSLLRVEYDGEAYYNFAYEIYRRYQKATGGELLTPPLDSAGMWNIAYSAKPGTYGQGLSFVDVLNGTVPAELFRDSIVIVGAYASGMLDSYATPIDSTTSMYGAEINANIVQALCEGKFKQNVSPLVQAVLLAALLLACGALFGRELAASALGLLLGTAGYVLAAVLLYRSGWTLDLLYAPLAVAGLYVTRVAVNFLEERRERLATMNTFKRYVSPEVARHLMEVGGDALKDSVRRPVAVMFIDIRGFTPLSEGLTPEQIVQILNEYLTLTSSTIFRNGGTVDKFIGDATMALFNAPADQDDYLYCAVKAAREIVEGGEALREKLRERFGKTVGFGVGVHCGEAVVGSIGAPFRMDYTAIGDTVNTASRLESVALAGQVLVSRDVCDALGDRIRVTFVGERQLKGKAKPTELWQVDGLV